MARASFASEFPNDNAEISGGAIWVCRSLTGPATLEAPPFEPVAAVPFVFWFDDEEPDIDGPVEVEGSASGVNVLVHVADAATSPEQAADEAPLVVEAQAPDEDAPVVSAAEPESPEAPAFALFERALATALLAQGASRSAAILPKILRLETLTADALTKDVQLTLQSRGYLDGSGRYSAKYRDLCGAWSAVLHGCSQDFAACGTTTLDRFGADLLAALLAVPATRSDELRRELRKSGVAAFGILEAA